MKLSEALRIIDDTVGMFRTFVEIIQYGDLQKDFLSYRVESYMENYVDLENMDAGMQRRECYTYVADDGEHKNYIVDIHSVCSFMIDEWPLPAAKKIRKLLCQDFNICMGLLKDIYGEDDWELNVPLDENYNYQRKYSSSQGPRTIENVIFDTIHEMYHALGVVEELDDVEDTTTGKDSVITEETASKMDWVRLTDGFNLEKIKEVVKKTGKNNEEKRTVVKAILTALYSIDKLYNIPYSVDKLILQLYQDYGGKRRDLHPSNLRNNRSYFDKPNIPKCLTTPEAKQILERLRKAGVLLEDWQPNGLSGPECGLVAMAICKRLDINNVWQVFGPLWNKKLETLRGYYNTALGQEKSLAFQDKLKEALA